MCIKHISAVLQRYTMLTRHGSPVTGSDRRNTFHKFIWMSRQKLLWGLAFFFAQSAVSLEHFCTLSLCHLCHNPNPNIYTTEITQWATVSQHSFCFYCVVVTTTVQFSFVELIFKIVKHCVAYFAMYVWVCAVECAVKYAVQCALQCSSTILQKITMKSYNIVKQYNDSSTILQNITIQFNNIVDHHNVSVERGPMETLSLLSRAIGQSHFGHFSLCIFILQQLTILWCTYSYFAASALCTYVHCVHILQPVQETILCTYSYFAAAHCVHCVTFTVTM